MRLFVISSVIVALLGAAPCLAEDKGSAGKAALSNEEESAKANREQHFLTGLKFSLWFDSHKDSFGPGVMWGLVLMPEKLEMELSIQSLVGGEYNTLPIDLMFKVPFRIGLWFVPYVVAGPILIIERERNRTWHDFAASAALGVAVNLPGFNWRVFVEGRYNLRFWEEIAHWGGLTFGFQYRF